MLGDQQLPRSQKCSIKQQDTAAFVVLISKFVAALLILKVYLVPNGVLSSSTSINGLVRGIEWKTS